MATFHIRKGRDIPIKGAAKKEIADISLPTKVAVQPPDFRGLKMRLIAKEGAQVKVGSVILEDKNNHDIKITSPASGKVVAVNRGEKRALLEIVIETDGKQECEEFQKFNEQDLNGLNREAIVKRLLESGLWPAVRQRPFSKVANPEDKPKSIFIHAMSTEPLSLDTSAVLEGKEKEFYTGLKIIKLLTEGDVNLCYKLGAQSKALTEAKDVEKHQFQGPHPTGNVGTHIHCVDPIGKGDIVWYIEAQDVLRIARLFLEGKYPVERVVAVTGEGAKNRVYAKTIVGAPLSSLLQGSDLDGMRCLSGSILTGREVGREGFVGYYDSQITVIPEGGEREFLGWLSPGFEKFTFSHTFLSAFMPQRNFSLDTDTHGGDRAIVLNHLYDDLNTLDVLTYFLLKAVIAGEIDDCERLGILECAEEDFALCTFACPSKTDVGGIIRQGLDVIEKEG